MRTGKVVQFILVILLVICGIVIGQSSGYIRAQTPTDSTPEIPTEIAVQAFVIQSAEPAQVRRAGWTNFTALSLGVGLQPGDLVDPKGNPVRLICADLSKQVIAVLGPIPCPKDRIITTQDGMQLAGWQRGSPVKPTIPYLISPRATYILDPQPLILWNPVGQADSYQITVHGEGLEWSDAVKGQASNSLVYPKTAPQLQPDSAYTVEITALSQGEKIGVSTAEEAQGISFSIIPPAQATQLIPLRNKLQAQVVDQSVADLIIAQVYVDSKLYADALDLLLPATKDVGKNASTSPILQLILGNIYLRTGVQLEAEAAYQRALTLAQTSGDLETQAFALTGLARLNPNTDAQTKLAKQAIDLWNQLGAATQVATLTKEFDLTGN